MVELVLPPDALMHWPNRTIVAAPLRFGGKIVLLGIGGQQVIDHRFDGAGCLFETSFVNHFIGTHPAKSASKLDVRFGFWNFSDN